MFRINEYGLPESIFPIEDLCVHCGIDCSSRQDRKDYEIMLSLNPEDGFDYIINCNGFESCDGMSEVAVKVEENLPVLDQINLGILAQEILSRKYG